MKKYEAPMVELTKFDVEDVITTSIGVTDLVNGTASVTMEQAVADIKAGTTAGDNNLNGVFSW